jgi:type IV pilus assembly protein PilY1
MLVLDTSGSMEYAVGQEAEWALPECHDEKQGEFAYEKSRWIVVLEALTGTFNGYWCKYDNRDDDPEREDYMVPIPHVVPMGDEVDGEMQQADGLVDLYADQVKFGLMAFDSKPPTDLGPAGGFSYGLDKDGGLGNVNLGIRNQSAPWGALITPPLEDAADAMMTAGDSVQEHILASTPYSGSPVSPALDDALYFVQTDDSIKLYSPEDQSGDKFSACRTKILILVTSGQANLGEGSSGYPFSAAIAVQLAGAGIQLHVVGIDVEVGSEEWLHALAEAGGTGNALIVEDPSQLRSTLETVFLNAMEDQQ